MGDDARARVRCIARDVVPLSPNQCTTRPPIGFSGRSGPSCIRTPAWVRRLGRTWSLLYGRRNGPFRSKNRPRPGGRSESASTWPADVAIAPRSAAPEQRQAADPEDHQAADRAHHPEEGFAALERGHAMTANSAASRSAMARHPDALDERPRRGRRCVGGFVGPRRGRGRGRTRWRAYRARSAVKGGRTARSSAP